MSNINNLNNLPPQALQSLLAVASKKLGTTPETLQKQLQDGTFDKALSGMPANEAAMLTQALSNKAACERILSSPQAQAIYRKLSGK
ncbi:MAG: hypothetical protein J5994_10130 [Ruminococcus sp.]|nr:hypothetical protein [Ruminococcus sp.]